jgi:hypothetical protein
MWYVWGLFCDPNSALRKAIQLANEGNFQDAARVLTGALNKMPPPVECDGKSAEQRFLLR